MKLNRGMEYLNQAIIRPNGAGRIVRLKLFKYVPFRIMRQMKEDFSL